MTLPEALDAETGLTCVVGAGGKKTTLYALADRLDRAVVTATVRIPIFDAAVAEMVVTDDPVAALDATDAPVRFPLGLVPEREREDRYRGYDPETVSALAGAHDGPVLAKADGARTRWLKAPNQREPRIPAAADTVVPIASARVVGETLSDDRVHRPGRVAAVADREVGDEIRPEDVAAVLASDEGGLKGVPKGATAVPVVNMVDSPELERTGREIAEGVLDRTPDGVSRVVLTRMVADDPVVAVVE
ncbi:selenium cofactor biosynthesis protein YqeC [Halorussus sp. MSC15.2]|uniref:selenium cofactor biosynthesis protein YqeC n=1 Tax=Halorussus sp. MSC15.2 TaxID=2283638 RepID=UPI0013D14893|nr:selenium cofactor biosynthesis protein YqeC [Halorussus sp. MSC15.2]NEU55499.1 putative selenium-dependent hydroxylase accessory protein YqeC [Halorussus sp. MSC15.2]